MTENNASRFVVMTAAAKMPRTCKGRYRRVAVVELTEGFEGVPAMISERARGVARIVAIWDQLNVGKTDACAYARALAEAETMRAAYAAHFADAARYAAAVAANAAARTVAAEADAEAIADAAFAAAVADNIAARTAAALAAN